MPCACHPLPTSYAWAALAAAGTAGLAARAPGELDSALFGPTGGLALSTALATWAGGHALGGGLALLPLAAPSAAPVPAAAPLHVFSLLGIGLADPASDAGAGVSAAWALLALAWGGL